MSKVTNENTEIIKNNLSYIGLNLDKIPKFLTEFEPLNFRTLKSYDDNIYKVYKYIDVKDIQILITPTDRLTDLKDKYKLAAPIFTYLDSNSEKNIEKFATFLNMLKGMNIDKIEQIGAEQEKLKQRIPYKVKYQNHFIWQIYYSDYAGKYFMLVPTNEQDNNALFYLLQKQITSRKTRKKEKIFVPISHLEYSGQYLSKGEIADIENYLWYFTKEWVSVYEVYDQKNNMSIRIVGNAPVYEKIRSDYCITLNNRQEAIEFYKLLKAMFILATGVSGEYEFETKISEDGQLEFYYEDKKLTYNILSNFVKSEYIDKITKLKSEISEKAKLEKRLKRFNNIVEELTQEYLLRQRQIATFLECKKTFLGRVKYFFTKKKSVSSERKYDTLTDRKEEKQEEEFKNLYEEKEQYTIEDLINICAKLEEKVKENKNLNLDIQAIETKKDILSKKIDNADLYIKEIDKHKKSIFEFWKFTSKDEIQTLNEAETIEDNNKEKISKFFNYETDLEELGKMVDEIQRRKLSKNETDAIFATKVAIKSMRELAKDRENEHIREKDLKVLERDLEHLKEKYKENIEYINIKDFDIFGGLSEDKTKIRTINNQKHREIEKDIYKVLNLNLDTEVNSYMYNLKNYLSLVLEAFNKIHTPYNMTVYKINTKKKIDSIDIFNINPQKVLEDALETKKENLILCRVDIKENMPAIFYSNIMFYDNFNKTLPLGMDLSSEVLLNIDNLNMKCLNEKEFNINYSINEFEVVTKKVKVYEYGEK